MSSLKAPLQKKTELPPSSYIEKELDTKNTDLVELISGTKKLECKH